MAYLRIMVITTSIFWPLGLFLTNNSHDFITYLTPSLLLSISFILNYKRNRYFLLPIVIIPLIDIKLTLFPLFIFLFSLFNKNIKTLQSKLFFIIIGILIIFFNRYNFQQNSVFKLEYEAKQEVLREIHLYPNPFLARTFQNKGRIVLDKLSDNFFALIDPGNYFFSFHPREGNIINQNLVKLPFLSLIPVVIGLLNIKKIKYDFAVISLIAGVFSLSFVEIFDRSDFILWLPILIIFTNGVNILRLRQYRFIYTTFSFLFIGFSLLELLRIIHIYR